MTQHIDTVSLSDLENVTMKVLKQLGEESEIGTASDKFGIWREIEGYVENILSRNGHKFKVLGEQLAWEDTDENEIDTVVSVEELHKIKKKIGERSLNDNAELYIIKAINEFKDARRHERGMPASAAQIVLRFTGKMAKAFTRFVESMEYMRCYILSFPPDKFYHLLAEFVLQEDDRKYHNIKQVVSDDALNYMHEEWMQRIETVMRWIADTVFSSEVDKDDMAKFIGAMGKKKVHVKYLKYNSKNWYCAIAIKKYGENKGWTYFQLLDKIEVYMRRRTKKVTTEILLRDMAAGVLDDLEKGKSKGRKIKNADERWYPEWKKNQPLQATTL